MESSEITDKTELNESLIESADIATPDQPKPKSKKKNQKRSSKRCVVIAIVAACVAVVAIIVGVLILIPKSQQSSNERKSSSGKSTTSDEYKYFTNWGNGKTAEQWKSRIIYQLLTDRFNRPDGRNTTCNLKDYNFCGGTWQGIIDKLDYIQNLGANAIWISNVVKNTPRGYHGYWPQDWFSVETETFGGSEDLKKLVIECHKRDIWVMVDYVYNHAGDVGTNYERITTFPKQDYYHDYCIISDWENEWQAKNCRYTSGLPDLNQDNPYVTSTLINATNWLRNNYHIDGFRVDTAKHIPVSFFDALVRQVPNFYLLLEATYGNPWDLVNYTNVNPNVTVGALNFPQWHTITDILWYGQSMHKIRERMDEFASAGIDPYALGTFIENHDKPRWLNSHPNENVYKNALTLTLLGASIPIIYYGSEQGFTGGDDPWNREVLWASGFNEENKWYKFIQTAAKARRLISPGTEQIQVYDDYNFYAFRRGPVLVCVTKTDWIQRDCTWLPAEFQPPCTLYEIFSGKTMTIYEWKVPVSIEYGQPQVWVPLDLWNRL